MKAQVTIAVIGKGRLGSAYARAIRSKSNSYKLFGHFNAREGNFEKLFDGGGPEVIIIATKDDAIAETAWRATSFAGNNLKLIVHSAGSQPSSILPKLPKVGRLMLHPIQTFPKGDPAPFKGIIFAAECTGKESLAFARDFTKSLGATNVIRLTAKQLPLYHAMTVFAANFITLLGASVEKLSSELRLDKKMVKKAVAPLMRTSLENVLAGNAKDVLTGPIARGDSETIKVHLKALKPSPELSTLYAAFVNLAKSSLSKA